MSFKYSEKLRNELIAYLKERYNLTISNEEAEQYLDSMAELYQVFM
jgi:acyl carrier protein